MTSYKDGSEVLRRIEQETDVVIVGGGISGCATAYYLAKRGLRVVLLEKDKIGAEGSGLSCGIIRKVGAVPTEIPLRMASVEIWEHVTHELKWQTGFIEGGVLYPAETEEQLKKMEEWVQIAQEAGMDCRIVSPEEVKKIVPPYEAPVVGGIYGEREGCAEPLLSTQSFAKAAEEAGARIYTNTPCWDIEVGGGRVVSAVTATGESIKTKTVVNAAGIYARRVANMVKFHVPYKVGVLGVAETEPLPPLFRPVYRAPRACAWQSIANTLWFIGPTAIMMDHDLGFDIFESPSIWWPRFLRFRKILSLHVNMGHLGREFRRVFGITRELRRKAEFPNIQPKPYPHRLEKYAQMQWQLMPSLRGTKIARMWAGFIDISPDMLPIIGEIDKPKGFVIASGFSGHGFTIGPIVGRLISELIIDGKPSLSLKEFSPYRFAEGKLGMPSETV